MIFEDEYKYYKQEFLANKNHPYFMSNRELAISFFEKLQEDFPDVSYYETNDIQQAIVYGKTAEIELDGILEAEEIELMRRMAALYEVRTKIQSNIKNRKEG